MTAAIRARLEELESSGLDPRSSELLVVLCWLVLDDVAIDDDELNAARRRAMFVLAAGGDPHRDVDLDSIAAERLADELDTPERRAPLAAALDELPERTTSPRSPGPWSRSAPTRSSPGARSRSRCSPTSSRTSSRLAGTRDYSGRPVRGDLETRILAVG